jgi:peptide subunit release factor 1 (eRF1)
MTDPEVRMRQYEISRLRRQHEHAQNLKQHTVAQALLQQIQALCAELEAVGESPKLGERLRG